MVPRAVHEGSLYSLRWSRGQEIAMSSLRVISLDHLWLHRLKTALNQRCWSSKTCTWRRRLKGHHGRPAGLGLGRSAHYCGLLPRASAWCPLKPYRFFLCWFHRGFDLFILVSNYSKQYIHSISATSSIQWCTIIHHLTHFYSVKN